MEEDEDKKKQAVETPGDNLENAETKEQEIHLADDCLYYCFVALVEPKKAFVFVSRQSLPAQLFLAPIATFA